MRKLGWLLLLICVILIFPLFQKRCGIGYYSAKDLAFTGVSASINMNDETAEILFNDVFFKSKTFGVWAKPDDILVEYRPNLNGVTVLSIKSSLATVLFKPLFTVWHASRVIVTVGEEKDVAEWKAFIQEVQNSLISLKKCKIQIKPRRVVPRRQPQPQKNKNITPTRESQTRQVSRLSCFYSGTSSNFREIALDTPSSAIEMP